MSEIKFHSLLAETVICPQIDIDGPIEDGIRQVLSQNLFSKYPELSMIKSPSKKVQQATWVQSFLGETILEVLTKMENSFSIILAAIPTSDGGFVLYLNEKEG